MTADRLDFEAFQARLDAVFPEAEAKDPLATAMERYGLYVGLAGIVIAVVGILIGGRWGAWIAPLGLVTEAAGLTFWLAFTLWRTRRTLALSFDAQSGAKELEQSFIGYQEIVSWLRAFPREEIESRRVFARGRVAAWAQASWLVGGLEKLGILPVLTALYLQFKDATWSWPPETTLLGALLASALIAFYVLGVWAMVRRTQVVRFERFLEIALDPRFKVVGPPGHASWRGRKCRRQRPGW